MLSSAVESLPGTPVFSGFYRCKSILNWDVVLRENRIALEGHGEGSMSKRSLALRVGGAAGDGVSSTAESFAKISARSGLHTWTYSSYQSVIRGGHRLGPGPRGLGPPPSPRGGSGGRPWP